mmetsp:Transcript_13329/g.29143  ORF Transcript_13329/g.29143 Transcript_13329/m.29143 type:complete len:319 (+) Transcript_13329:84-1040(+)
MADIDEFAELERAFKDKYQPVEKAGVGSDVLGEGTYGKVYKARRKSTGEIVAMKESKDSSEEGVPSTAIREVALLKELSHPNVVRLLDVLCSTTKLVLVFEFLEHDLKKYMRSVGAMLEPRVVQSLTFQLLDGIQFCHSNRILHRDLKPQNLLINRTDRGLVLKLADFGLARAYHLPVPKYTHEVVTVWYRPLEILLGCTHYSVPVDMWSAGCIIGEMASSAPLFAGDSEIDTIFKIFMKCGTPTVADWPGLQDLPLFKETFPKWPKKGWENVRNLQAQMGDAGVALIDKMLHIDPKRRISARTAIQQAYFQDVELPF